MSPISLSIDDLLLRAVHRMAAYRMTRRTVWTEEDRAMIDGQIATEQATIDALLDKRNGDGE
jgi:hypothetical protein